jgi:glycine hydroxymethyltransferase
MPAECEARVRAIARQTSDADPLALSQRLEELASQNRHIHEKECFNFSPAFCCISLKIRAV